MPRSRSFCRTKASIGLRTQALFDGRNRGPGDRLKCPMIGLLRRLATAAASPGQSAPRSIHARSSAICSAVSRGPEGGITTFGSSPGNIADQQALAAIAGHHGRHARLPAAQRAGALIEPQAVHLRSGCRGRPRIWPRAGAAHRGRNRARAERRRQRGNRGDGQPRTAPMGPILSHLGAALERT